MSAAMSSLLLKEVQKQNLCMEFQFYSVRPELHILKSCPFIQVKNKCSARIVHLERGVTQTRVPYM